jgi:hypothetical protein
VKIKVNKAVGALLVCCRRFSLLLFVASLLARKRKNALRFSSRSLLFLVVVRAQLAGHVLLLVQVERVHHHLARLGRPQDVVNLHLFVLVLLVVLEEAVRRFVFCVCFFGVCWRLGGVCCVLRWGAGVLFCVSLCL